VPDTVTDSYRFECWLQHFFEARQKDAETVSMGPFRAVVTPDEKHATSWVALVERDATKTESLRSLAKLRAAFAKHDVKGEVECNLEAFPHAGDWFEEAGLELVEKLPLMACRPDAFKPFAPADVSLTRLTEHAKPAELEAFQVLRSSEGGDIEREPPPVEKLQKELLSTASVFLLAWLDWEPVGTGVSHLTGDAAEIVGVVTRNDRRRRGVAAAVTSELVRRHFESGGDFVFLDAANEAAVKVYERLGFTRFGTKALYR
jgi:ribosomal protein S18 acetylase RimI-like enzyme